ncbi:MAG TPA: MFS transporter [Coriobacteriia bacterium]|nr:MFS transporter [Coriobacteriia bacterium]
MASSDRTVAKTKWIPLFIAVFIALVVDGMDLQLLNICLPVLKAEFALTQFEAGLLSSVTLIGMALGGLVAGVLADRIGRVKVTIISTVTFSFFTMLLGFTQTYWQFATVRFLSGFGIAALFAIGTLLVAEYVPTEKRGVIMGTLQAGWSIGYIAAALLSAALLETQGWRALFILSVVPAITSILILTRVKEPPGFLRQKQAGAVAKGNEYRRIWQNPSVRSVFIFWAIANTALQFGYYGANTWLPSYLHTDLGLDLKNMSLYIAGTYTAMVAGKILAGFLADRFGRKGIWMVGGLTTAVAMPLIVAYVNSANAIFLMVAFGFLYAIPYALLAAFMSESFPTGIRGTAVASLSSVGKIGSITAPAMVGFLANNYSIGFGIGILGIAYAVCALVPGIFLKEKAFDPSSVESCEGDGVKMQPSGTRQCEQKG